jgi:acetyl esterase
VVRALGALPGSVKRRIAGPPLRLDGLELDLDTQLLLRLAERNPPPPLSQRSLAQVRADLRRTAAVVAAAQIPVADVRDTSVTGAVGERPARMYTPEEAVSEQEGPLVLYFHGGGWVCGDLDTHDQTCRALAQNSGARVLSIDYRLAPEHPFPAPVEDALAAFHYVVANAATLSIDPQRIAIAGDSSGGHLAAVTAQQAAAAGGPPPAFQVLTYPVTDLAHESDSRKTFATGFGLTKENMEWYERQFLGETGDRYDPQASPILAPDLSNCPAALVITAGFDVLRDEGEAYAQTLKDAGVNVRHRRYPGHIHGFTHTSAIGPGARQALAEIGQELRKALAQQLRLRRLSGERGGERVRSSGDG